MKKLIINESERNEIRSLYNLSEQNDDNIVTRMIKAALAGVEGKLKSPNPDNTKNTTSNSDDNDLSPTPIDLSKVSAKGQELLRNPLFKEKLKEISKAINIDENSIIKLMKHESGLDPKIKNSIGCVGLIQFCPGGGSTKKIDGKEYSLEEIRNDLGLQMEAIKNFWVSGYKAGKIKRPEDLYIYNFFPVAAGKSDDFVLQTKGLSAKTIANANPVFNRTLGKPKSSPLTVGDLKDYYQQTGMV